VTLQWYPFRDPVGNSSSRLWRSIVKIAVSLSIITDGQFLAVKLSIFLKWIIAIGYLNIFTDL